MPRTINYLERYGALMGMDDRATVVKRLGATLDLADDILASADKVDARPALAEAAGAYAQNVMCLNGIRVAAADRIPENEELGEDAAAFASPDASAATAAIEAAFAAALSDVPEAELQALDEAQAAGVREKALDEQIDAAAEAAEKAAAAVAQLRAESVAGAVFSVAQPVPFLGECELKMAGDPTVLHELADEVRKSFGTFKQVVADNGLFAAFSNDGGYGACQGTTIDLWWDDLFVSEFYGKKPGSKTYDDIATGVEEDRGGDSVERAIERMREFNKQKYWGLLDDFSSHVDAFWYGFKKLMEGANGLFELDLRAFGNYCGQVTQAAQDAAGELGACMDSSQLDAFCKEVNKRAKAL